GVMILALSAIAYRLAHARPAPQAQAGTQPTYFVEHPDHIQPGLTFHGRWAAIANPYAGNQQRIDEGGKLFVAYNCWIVMVPTDRAPWDRACRTAAGISARRTPTSSSPSTKGGP